MTKKRFLRKINPKFLDGIAHRGLHNNELIENSLGAFKNAIDHNVAIELDIHVTQDNELIVCHDHDLLRTTGKEGQIEHLTSKEIRDNYRLLNGEVVPTLKEVLEVVNEQVPLVIELKVIDKNHHKVCKKLKELLKQYIKDKKNYMLISFDPRALWPFLGFGIMRSLLIAKSHEFTWKYAKTVESIDVEYLFIEDRRLQKYYKNHFVNVWTIDSMDKLNKVKKYCDTVTYQFLDTQEVKVR